MNDPNSLITALDTFFTGGKSSGGGGAAPVNTTITQPTVGGVRNTRVAPDVASATANLGQASGLNRYQQSNLPAVAHGNMNIPRGNIELNANRMGSYNTLALSRLADARNNRYYRQGRRISNVRTLVGGGTAGTPASFGELYRMPITTEEMRQQETIRDLSRQEQQMMMERQDRYRNRPFERDQQIFDEVMRREGAVYDQNMERDYQVFYNYLTQLTLKEEQAALIMRYYLKNPVLGSMVAAMLGTLAPEARTLLMGQEAAKIFRDRNLTEAEMYSAFNQLYLDYTVEAAKQTARTVKNLPAAAKEFLPGSN